MFAKLIPYLCHITNKDEGFEVKTPTNTGIGQTCIYMYTHVVIDDYCPSGVSIRSFSDIVFGQLLSLLKKEVADHSRHLQQYFQVFLAYCHKGATEVCYTCTCIYMWIDIISGCIAPAIIEARCSCPVYCCCTGWGSRPRPPITLRWFNPFVFGGWSISQMLWRN